MKPALLEFERSTGDLSRLLSRAQIEDELLALDVSDTTPDAVKSTLIRFRSAVEPFALRQAQYAMQLVLLYGAFERVMEGFLVGTLAALNEIIPTFPELPQKIQENHRRKSLDALRDDVWISRRGDPLLPPRLIENLHSCEARAANYKVNHIAYGRHGGNFRRNSIDEAFRDAGVEGFLLLVAEAPEFKEYLGVATREKGLLDETFGGIDDLAERRNEIAHGNPTQLLTRNQLAYYVEFFNAFSRASYATLRRHLGRYLVAHHATPLGRLGKVHYKHVFYLDLGVLPEGTWVEVGDPLAIDLGAKMGYEIAYIKNIRTESGDVGKFRSQNGMTVAIESSARLRDGQKLFLVNPDCPAPWLLSPPTTS